MRKFLFALLLLPGLASAQQLINCATGVPCDATTGPAQTHTGDPFWQAFGKVNANFNTLGPLFIGSLPTGTLLFPTGTITYAGVSGPSNSWMYLSGGLVGTATQAPLNSIISPFNLNIGNDTVDTTTTGNGNLIDFSIRAAASPGHTGGREAFQSSLLIVGTPGTHPGAIGYVSNLSLTHATANLMGLPGIFANYSGGLFAGNDNVYQDQNATNTTSVVGREIDIAVAAGNTAEKHALLLVNTSIDTARADYDDSVIEFGSQTAGGVTAKYGISFGSYSHPYSFGTDSTLIAGQQRQTGPTSNSVALNGVDWRSIVFQSGGYAFVSKGWGVDPNGVQNSASLTTVSGISQQTATVASIAPVAFGGVTGGSYFGSAVFPSITIGASAGGGTQAAANTATMALTRLTVLTAGTGASNNDVLTLTGDTGTEPTVTLGVSTFTGSIAGNVLTVPGAVTGPALAANQLISDGGVNISSALYIVSGSGTTWRLSGSATAPSEAMVATSASITTAGSVTAKVANEVTTGGTASVQPTFSFGWGIATVTVSNAGTLYACSPPPNVTVINTSTNTNAQLAATMSCTTVPVTMASGASLPSVAIAGNISAASWTTNGVGLNGTTTTYTDTTGSGTIALEAAHALPVSTIATTAAGVTITDLDELYIPTPLAGTNVTATRANSLQTAGPIRSNGLVTGVVGANFFGGAVSLNVNSNNATSIGTGSTTSNVNIGGGSNTIAIGSNTNITGTTNVNASNNAVTNIGTGTTTSNVNIGGGSNTVAVTAATNINVSNNQATSIGTGSTTSNVNLGGGSNTIAINGTLTTTGTASINANNNAATNIGTGTTTSAVNIANGTGNNAVNIGNGTGKISVSGPLLSAAGTRFSVASGTGACATSSTLVGGVQAGDLTCTGTTGASTVTLTLVATTTAYACWGRDITTPTTVTQTGAKSTTSVTLTLTSVTQNDVVQFGCLGY